MEISFENRKVKAFYEVFHQIKRIQESVEGVVPDVNDDIGRIASVQTEVMLKSKDVNSHGVTVNGEARATLVYITEDETKVSFVELAKAFVIEYETANASADILSQVAISISNTEARILNPRKVSVLFEICGEMSCYLEDSVSVENMLPADSAVKLHTKYEAGEIDLTGCVCEKTFAVTEQFPFPSGKPVPEKLLSHKAEFIMGDTQMIGSKMIVKGRVELTAYYTVAGEAYPVKAEFSAPFSQIIDTGRENMESCTAFITQTSAYYDIIDTINGEKAFDVEIHAVTQAVSRCRQSVNYITDAYSNEFPTECVREQRSCGSAMTEKHISLSSQERVSISEDCEEVVCTFVGITQTALSQGKVSCCAGIDVLYRNKNGTLSAVRRIAELEGESSGAERILSAKLSSVSIEADGKAVNVALSAEICGLSGSAAEFSTVSSVNVSEDEVYNFSAFPTVTLVRGGKAPLWELAKKYHSSVERIAAVNGDIADGRVIMIPKSL